MNEHDTTHAREFIWRRLTEGFSLSGHDFPGTIWLFVLAVILVVGVVYVVWMYVRDGHSIGWFWGALLAGLRLTVYGILAVVFLLPGYQNWEESHQQSKVVVVGDISASMDKQDDPVLDGADQAAVAARPSRQDKVLDFLGDPADPEKFFQRLQKNNPVTVYRFGSSLDENYLHAQNGRVWTREQWEKYTQERDPSKKPEGSEFTRSVVTDFFKPDLKAAGQGENAEALRRLERLRKSTNVADSAATLISKEGSQMVQGVVIFTDAHSTEGGDQAQRDLADRARRARIPVFVVVVGEDRPETRIEIVDASGPDRVRPNDPFPINVAVTGVGLDQHNVEIFLDVYRPGQDPKKDRPFMTLPAKKTTFKGAAELPRAQAEFVIDPKEMGEVPSEKPPEKTGDKPGEKPAGKPADKPDSAPTQKELAQGDWKFVPRVPRDQNETTAEPFHTREPVVVRVEDKSLSVLLFASAPMRDYQFVRTLLVREFDKKRLDLAIYLQPLPDQAPRIGIVQDVPPSRMLKHFPDKLYVESSKKGEEPAKPADPNAQDEAIYNLAKYDVIVAFDPNWNDPSINTELLERWMTTQGGGLIAVGGPIHTLQLAKSWQQVAKKSKADRESFLKSAEGAGVKRLMPIINMYPVFLKDLRLEKDRNTSVAAGLEFPGASPEMEFLKLDEDSPSTKPTDAWKEFFAKKEEGGVERVTRGFFGYYPVERPKDVAVTVATFADHTPNGVVQAPYLVILPQYGGGRSVWLGSAETWRLRQFREVWHERFWTKLIRYAGARSTGGTATRRIQPRVGKQFKAGQFAEFRGVFYKKDLTPIADDERPRPRVVLHPPVGAPEGMKLEYDMEPEGKGEGRFVARARIMYPGKYRVDMSMPSDPNEPAVSTMTEVVESDPETEDTRPDLAAAYEMASDAEDVIARVEDPAKREALRNALLRYNKPATSSDKPAEPGKERKDRLRLVFDLQSAALIPDCMLKRESTQQSRGKVEDLWDDGFVLRKAQNPDDKPLKFSYVLGAVVLLLSAEWLARKLLRLA
jgi:hypothetical protein